MRIGLEASALLGCKSGVGYYTENLLAGMVKTAPDHEYILFSNQDMRDGWRRMGHEVLYNKDFFPIRAAWMQAILPRTLKRVRLDVCHFTNYLAPVASGCPYVVTIHDMTLYITPRLHRFKKLALDRTLIPYVARRAGAIITVSNSAKKDIVRFLHVPEDKVRVIPNSVSSSFTKVEDPDKLASVLGKYGLNKPYILYVGTIEPRKNLARLIQAYAQLKRRGISHKLVMVGQPGWHCAPIYAEVERLGLQRDVIFTGYVPFEYLPAFYSGADVMAFPSLYEGFGLPVVEAMACGIPVITSNSSSLAEVADGAALLVNPLSVTQIANALDRVLSTPDLRTELSSLGLWRAAHFNQETSARATLEVYEKVGSR